MSESKDDGIALYSAVHPKGSWISSLRLWFLHLIGRDLNPDSLETVEIEVPEK